jgi:hypothetical protein
MAQPWNNADGLSVKFGNYWSDPKNFTNKSWSVSTMGPIQVLEMDYDLSKIANGTVGYPADLNNDGTADGFTDEHPALPAGASILRVTLVATTAAAGGTSFTVGTYRKTGAAVAATGLVTATEGVLANVDTVGKRVYGAGALTASAAGTAGVGANNVWVGLGVTGTFTAGKGKIIIEYVEGAPRAAAND